MPDVNAPKQTRRERAAATRVRMTEAALEVFVEKGYQGTRMAEIAERAGVAVQTLYFTFHTKPELLEACYAHAVLGGPDGVAPMDTPELKEAFTSRSRRGALRAFARGNVAITARAAAIDAVAAAATHEPEVASVREHSEGLRRESYA
ncbi:MAG: helix-turn-helix transcriptional regulator, partial [Marmoricola sp.]|nr:helix-turn-helix transcriptional regulator [Marmoricola sp.]